MARLRRLCVKRLSQIGNDERRDRMMRRPDKMDTSQAGNGSNFRNMALRGKPVAASALDALLMDLPPSGTLEFDYVTLYRDTTNAT